MVALRFLLGVAALGVGLTVGLDQQATRMVETQRREALVRHLFIQMEILLAILPRPARKLVVVVLHINMMMVLVAPNSKHKQVVEFCPERELQAAAIFTMEIAKIPRVCILLAVALRE